MIKNYRWLFTLFINFNLFKFYTFLVFYLVIDLWFFFWFSNNLIRVFVIINCLNYLCVLVVICINNIIFNFFILFFFHMLFHNSFLFIILILIFSGLGLFIYIIIILKILRSLFHFFFLRSEINFIQYWRWGEIRVFLNYLRSIFLIIFNLILTILCP